MKRYEKKLEKWIVGLITISSIYLIYNISYYIRYSVWNWETITLGIISIILWIVFNRFIYYS